MRTVSFTAMHEGSKDDYDLLARYEEDFARALPDRILKALSDLSDSLEGFQIDRLQHSLQSATRAHHDSRDEEYVVAALVHDMGDTLAPFTHGEMMGAVLAPYLPARLCWIVAHHPVFQQHYFGRHTGQDPDARERWRGHVWFDDCVEFCERYDENCFDPDYENLPLAFFEPMVERTFAEPRYLKRT